MRGYVLRGVVMLVIVTFVTWVALQGSLEAWDESRRGINALRMLQQGDWWNYRFLDLFDTFNTKPPAFTWLLAGIFQVAGVSLLTLRAISVLGFLILLSILYAFTKKWAGRSVAIITVATTLSCKGLFGFHVATNGDTDMLFVLFLTVSLLSWFSFVAQRQNFSVLLLAVVALALAFLTKGLAVALIAPAVLTHAYLSRELLLRCKGKVLAATGLLAGLGVMIWWVCANFGLAVPGDYQNLWQQMFATDGLQRFTDGSMEVGYQWGYLPMTLDIRFSPWIYVLYAGMAYALWRSGFSGTLAFIRKDPFLVFSLLVVLSVSGVLLASQNKHQWYIAPMLPFLTYPVALIVQRFGRRNPRWYWVFGLVVVLFTGSRVYESANEVDPVGKAVATHAPLLLATDSLLVPAQTPQDLLFHLYLLNPDIRLVTKNVQGLPRLERGDCEDGVLGYCFRE